MVTSFIERVPFAYRATVYCTAIRHGTKSDWDSLVEGLTAADLPEYERNNLLYGLSCSKEVWQVQFYLDKVVKLEKEVLTHLRNAVVNPNGHAVAWNFIKENWTSITQK